MPDVKPHSPRIPAPGKGNGGTPPAPPPAGRKEEAVVWPRDMNVPGPSESTWGADPPELLDE